MLLTLLLLVGRGEEVTFHFSFSLKRISDSVCRENGRDSLYEIFHPGLIDPTVHLKVIRYYKHFPQPKTVRVLYDVRYGGV